MKKFLYILFVFIRFSAVAQVSDMVFVGTANLKSDVFFTYKLQVTDSAGVLRGYSVTDVMGEDETKTAVRGTIDIAKKQMNIVETRMIYTKSSSPKSDFCYVHAHLKISGGKGTTMLKGRFTGYKEDGKTECASGTLTLVSAKDVLDKLLQLVDTSKLAHPADTAHRRPTEIVYEKEVAQKDILKVAPGKTLELVCPDTAVRLDIWDSEHVDGDIISLYEGNKPLLQNFLLTGRNKTVHLRMPDQGNDTLTLVAENEGTDPTNTARVKITSGKMVRYLDATTTVDKKVTIVLKRP